MLWYKAWLETRARFLICLLGMVALCSFVVYHGDDGAMPYTGRNYFFFVLRSGHTLLCMMWVTAVTLLMMGGLLREKSVGTATFTLALPVSRGRLMSVRIALGAIQAIALAVLPWSAMFLTDRIFGKAHDIGQMAFHLAILIGGGLVFFAMALLVSCLVEGEYTAPVASLGVMLTMTIVLGDGPWRTYSPFAFINGIEYFDRYSGMLQGPVPWAHVSVSLVLAALLTLASVKVIQRREF